MTGEDFHTLAVDLLSGTTAAHFRSSVSRAYYGAYHSAVVLCQTIGISLPRSGNCHEKLKDILDMSKDPALMKTMSKFNELRRARNDADYHLDRPKPSTKSNAVLQVKIAADLIVEIKSHLPAGGLEPKHEACRSYARDTLRLTVK